MYKKCECGREFESKQSYCAHCGHCKVHLADRYDPMKHNAGNRIPDDKRAWSRGLSKYTDDRVAKQAELVRGRPSNFLGMHHTEETKSKLSEAGKYNAKNHINGWKAGSSKIQNKYEELAMKILSDNNIKFEQEFVVSKKSVGAGVDGYYQLDFLVDNKIDLEIDGSSHSESYDLNRDSHIGNIYEIYRIRHNDSIDEVRSGMIEFLLSIGVSNPVINF